MVICTFPHEITISTEPRVTILRGNSNIIYITKIDAGRHVFILNRSRYHSNRYIYILNKIYTYKRINYYKYSDLKK